MTALVTRVGGTATAAKLLARLVVEHGELVFHHTGNRDGSAPTCYPLREFQIAAGDVLLGQVHGTPFFVGAAQFEYWKHAHLTVDVVPRRVSSFSLEAPRGVRFIVRSRELSGVERALLEGAGPPPAGPEALLTLGARGGLWRQKT